MYELEGKVFKLSQVNKIIDRDNKLHILHCNCLSPYLWEEEEKSDNYSCDNLHCSDMSCSLCGLYPWERSVHGKRELRVGHADIIMTATIRERKR
jgi:hypothetical protein